MSKIKLFQYKNSVLFDWNGVFIDKKRDLLMQVPELYKQIFDKVDLM